MNQSDVSIESYSGSPTSPEKWPGISPSRRCAANVFRTCARPPTRPCASARPGRGDHGLASPVREPRETREHGRAPVRYAATKTSARLASSSKTGSDVDANSRRRRALGVEELVGVARDFLERKEGEGLRVRAAASTPIRPGSRGLLRSRSRARPPRRSGSAGTRSGPRASSRRRRGGTGAAGRGAASPSDVSPRTSVVVSQSVDLLLEAVRSPEGQQRADAEVSLGRSPGSSSGRPSWIGRARRRASVRSRDRRTRGARSGKARGGTATATPSRRRTARRGRPASRGSSVVPGRSRTPRSRRPSSSAGAAEGSPARTSRGSGGSAGPEAVPHANPPSPSASSHSRARPRPRSSSADHSRGLRDARGRRRRIRRSSRQAGRPFRSDSLSHRCADRSVAPRRAEPRRLRGLFMRARNKIGPRRLD